MIALVAWCRPHGPSQAERPRAEGVFPWWADDTAKLYFFRPLASLNHSIDHERWPAQPVLDHAQNVLWYLFLLGSLWLVLRRSMAPRWLGAKGARTPAGRTTTARSNGDGPDTFGGLRALLATHIKKQSR